MALGKIAQILPTLVKMMNQATAKACKAQPDCAKTKTVKTTKPLQTKKVIELIEIRTKY